MNDAILSSQEKPDGLGVVIDIDLGAAKSIEGAALDVYVQFVNKLMTSTKYMPQSLNSSLGFAYTAIGARNPQVHAQLVTAYNQ